MNPDQLTEIDQIKSFLEGAQPLVFEVASSKEDRYKFIQRSLVKFEYIKLKRPDKSLLIQFFGKITGYSRQQLTRLIQQYVKTGQVVRRQCTQKAFTKRYTALDIALLAQMDERHGQLSGAATKKLCERAYRVFGDEQYERLSKISIAHLYNLRNSTAYRRKRCVLEKTKPKNVTIGQRRKPNPKGQPGYIRIDTVHQGDWDKIKGVYHINAVDEVTQFEAVMSVEGISEAFLIPVLEALLDTFPFKLQGFHSDNGSEYINYQVAGLLEKLHIEFTKSRARRSNDNGLVESKNASVVRKHWGYAHIPQQFASLLNEFNQQHLNPYVNYHRPCFYPETIINEKGKQKKRYRYKHMMTPYEKLKSLPEAAQYLKPGISFEQLDRLAYGLSDNEACDRKNKAQQQLWQTILHSQNSSA